MYNVRMNMSRYNIRFNGFKEVQGKNLRGRRKVAFVSPLKYEHSNAHAQAAPFPWN
jgi:hypothetical protein